MCYHGNNEAYLDELRKDYERAERQEQLRKERAAAAQAEAVASAKRAEANKVRRERAAAKKKQEELGTPVNFLAPMVSTRRRVAA